MNKRLLLGIYIAGLLILVGGVNAADCFVRSSCLPGENPVLHLSSTSNAHAEYVTETNYINILCCPGITANSVSGDVDALHLFSPTNANVELNTESNFNNKLYLSNQQGNLQCQYKALCDAITETCVASFSDGTTNLHLGECNSYTNNLCCQNTACGPEICDNDLDDDCDGTIDDIDCCSGTIEICDNGQDDNCDGTIDEVDDCCPGTFEICDNGLDDNCDGTIDDINCCPGTTLGQENIEASCNDCMDNDCDGDMDGVDTDCQGSGPLLCLKTVNQETGLCGDGLDNDCDGYDDLEDSDCNGNVNTCAPLGCVSGNIWDQCTTAQGYDGVYNENCECIPTNQCAGLSEGESCTAVTLDTVSCDGTCTRFEDGQLYCIDNQFDGCPSCDVDRSGEFCLYGRCRGTLDSLCNCQDDPNDGCGGTRRCGNGYINAGEACDRTNLNGNTSCSQYLQGTVGEIRCNAACRFAGCYNGTCVPAVPGDNCQSGCGFKISSVPGKCYSNNDCSKLCSDEIDLDINSDNIVTQRKVVIYNGKPIVINIVVWE